MPCLASNKRITGGVTKDILLATSCLLAVQGLGGAWFPGTQRMLGQGDVEHCRDGHYSSVHSLILQVLYCPCFCCHGHIALLLVTLSLTLAQAGAEPGAIYQGAFPGWERG